MMKRTYPSFITSIVPVYNVRPYLADTIESIVNQSIGFKDNVHLILVDDGSTDGSGEICREYAKQYPDNIEYIHQENAGVSAARNNGLKHANGKYIHFLDSDDIISKNYYAEGVRFLGAHADEIDFVAAKIQFFDASIDAHPNNYKFSGRRVIDIDQDPDNVVMHVSSCLFLRESLKGKSFDTMLKIAEDAKFVTDVLEKKRKYGVLKDSSLYYRKRSDGSSAINGQYKNKSFYTETPIRFLEHLLDSWSKGGRTNLYAQNVVLYDLHWRLRQESQTVLSEKEQLLYVDIVQKLINRIDDMTIVRKRGISAIEKRYLLSKKHGKEWVQLLGGRNSRYIISDDQLFDVSSNLVYLDFVESLGDEEWKIEGYLGMGRITPQDGMQIKVGDVSYEVTWVDRETRKKTFLGDVLYDGGSFEAIVKIPSVKSDTIIEFNYIMNNGESVYIPAQTNRYTGMSVLPFSYRRKGDFIFRKNKGRIVVSLYTKYRSLLCEMRYLGVIIMNWRLRTMKERLSRLRRYNLHFLSAKQRLLELLKPFAFSVEAILMIPRALLLRAVYRIKKPAIKRPIWIISDRGMAAGDNGEALYRYILNYQRDVPADVYFAISKKSADFSRIKSMGGRIVSQDSLKYKLLFLLSSKIISSQADVETTNPFIRQINHYVDLFNFDFIFLQHGIIRHDLTKWLNRFEKDIKLFVTSAQTEYDSILRLPYYYDEKNVLLSGLPRYDRLESSPKGKLILAPTYRKGLARSKTDKNGARMYDPNFKKSEYRDFYNNLMNDIRIKEVLRRNNMSGELYLHPVFSAQSRDFEGNDFFKVKSFPYNYSEAFRDGSIMVSDFSSVMFDFSYLKKPVVYSQFDKESFFRQHTYDESDFFIDERDGFGPVTYTYEDLVSEIVRIIDSECLMDDKYINRVERFFYKQDKNNSERVYKAIQSL